MTIEPGPPESNTHLHSATLTPDKFQLGFNFRGGMFLLMHSYLTCNLGVFLFSC